MDQRLGMLGTKTYEVCVEECHARFVGSFDTSSKGTTLPSVGSETNHLRTGCTCSVVRAVGRAVVYNEHPLKHSRGS
jgi:hypothetical protein